MFLGPKVTTETPDYDRNVPGKRAQATQVGYKFSIRNDFIHRKSCSHTLFYEHQGSPAELKREQINQRK